MARKWLHYCNLPDNEAGGVTICIGGSGTWDENHIHFAHSEGIRPLLRWLRARHPHHEFKSEKDGYGGWHVMESPYIQGVE